MLCTIGVGNKMTGLIRQVVSQGRYSLTTHYSVIALSHDGRMSRILGCATGSPG